MDTTISTTIVPLKFHASAYLVGQIPFTALKSDPRISYALYVPPSHYENPPGAKIPLLVSIHGTRRNMSSLYTSLPAFADSTPCAILVPLFPAGLEGPNDFNLYMNLRIMRLRSDLAVLGMLDEIAFRWPGIETEKVFMMGFSGGGQFVHRFLYLYPERLRAVSVGAPGQVTLLDRELRWPKGIKDVEEIFGRGVDREAIAKVRIQLVIGGEDNKLHGGEDFWAWVRKAKRAQRAQRGKGRETDSEEEKNDMTMRKGRLDTLRELNETWKKELGIESEIEIVEGVAHSASGVEDRVFDFIRPLISEK